MSYASPYYTNMKKNLFTWIKYCTNKRFPIKMMMKEGMNEHEIRNTDFQKAASSDSGRVSAWCCWHYQVTVKLGWWGRCVYGIFCSGNMFSVTFLHKKHGFLKLINNDDCISTDFPSPIFKKKKRTDKV